MGLVDDGGQFFIGKLQRVMAGHDLDQISPALDLLAHGAAHLVGPARLAAHPVGMPAGLDDGVAADLEPWPWENPLFNGLF